MYASAKDGWAVNELTDAKVSVTPLLDAVVERVSGPNVEIEAPFQLQVATIGYDDFVGRIAVGRIQRGTVRKGDTITCISHDGSLEKVESAA